MCVCVCVCVRLSVCVCVYSAEAELNSSGACVCLFMQEYIIFEFTLDIFNSFSCHGVEALQEEEAEGRYTIQYRTTQKERTTSTDSTCARCVCVCVCVCCFHVLVLMYACTHTHIQTTVVKAGVLFYRRSKFYAYRRAVFVLKSDKFTFFHVNVSMCVFVCVCVWVCVSE